MKIRIRRLLIPALFVLAVACLVEVPLMQTTIFGEAVVLWDTLFRAVIAVPVLGLFYKEDRPFRTAPRWNLKIAFFIVSGGIFASLFLRFIISRSALSGYDQAEAMLLAGPLWLQVLVLLFASPILEELFFRGVLYQRLKELISIQASVTVTALLFGLFHGNPAQMVYGLLMGIILARLMEACQTVKAPILFHTAANAAALFLAFLERTPM